MTRASRPSHNWRGVARSRVTTLMVLGACAMAAFVPRSEAQELSAEVPGYREAIGEALAEYEAQNYLEAMSQFTRAHKLSPSARTLRGLGAVAFELRRYSESVSFLEQALSSERRRLDSTMRAETERLLARARGYVAELRIELEPGNGRVHVDGAQAAWVAGQPLPLDIGKHQLEFSATGYVSEQRAYTVIGGESATWRVSLRPASSAAKPQDVKPPSKLLRWHKVLGAAAIGLGTASIVTAGVLTVHRHAESNHFRSVDSDASEYPAALKAWGDTRPPPYFFAGAGALAFTSGATALFLKAPDRHFVRVGAGISAAAGVVLATVGAVELLRGGPCGSDAPDRQACSRDLERRDRGAIMMLSAFPLLVPPIVLLLRNWLGEPRVSAVDVSSSFDPHHRSALLNVRGAWL